MPSKGADRGRRGRFPSERPHANPRIPCELQCDCCVLAPGPRRGSCRAYEDRKLDGADHGNDVLCQPPFDFTGASQRASVFLQELWIRAATVMALVACSKATSRGSRPSSRCPWASMARPRARASDVLGYVPKVMRARFSSFGEVKTKHQVFRPPLLTRRQSPEPWDCHRNSLFGPRRTLHP
jgi:hypothetical protein